MKSVHIMAVAALVVGMAHANPRGGSVAYGTVGIDQSNPAITRITQGSDRAIVNWQGFSNQASESIRFQQPSASSVILNRVVSGDPSRIEGAMSSNGQVFLVNPNGITFGSGAKVNVGGLVASTLSMKDADFVKGQYRLQQEPGRPMAAVVNKGEIRTAPGGMVALVAPVVDNQGTIVAAAGRVSLAAGTKAVVNPDGRGLVNLEYDGPVDGPVRLAKSDTSQALARIVNTSNAAPAASMTVCGCTVTLNGAAGIAINQGTIATPGAAGVDAGAIHVVSARATALTDTSRLLANGSGARSNGGEVRALSSGTTVFARGSVIEAKGGGSGDGGFVEISGTRKVVVDGKVDTTAANGAVGTLLIDPKNLVVVNPCGQNATIDGNGCAFSTACPFPAIPAACDAFINVNQLACLSHTNNINLIGCNVIFKNSVPLMLEPGRTLTVNATGGDITAQPASGCFLLTSLGRTKGIFTRGDITMTATGKIDLGCMYIRSDGPNAHISLTAQGGGVTVGMVIAAPGGTPGAAGGRVDITAKNDIQSGVVQKICSGCCAPPSVLAKVGAQYTPNAQAALVNLVSQNGGIFGKDATTSFSTAAGTLTASAATQIRVQDIGTAPTLTLGNVTAPTVSIITNGAIQSAPNTNVKGTNVTFDSLKTIGAIGSPVNVDVVSNGTLVLKPGSDTSPALAAVIAGNVPGAGFTVPNTRAGLQINGITVSPAAGLAFFTNTRTATVFTDMAESAANTGISRQEYMVHLAYRGGVYTDHAYNGGGYATITDETSGAFTSLLSLLAFRINGNDSPGDVTVLASLGASTKNGADIGFPPAAGEPGSATFTGPGGTSGSSGTSGSGGTSGSDVSSNSLQSTQFVSRDSGPRDGTGPGNGGSNGEGSEGNRLVSVSGDDAQQGENNVNLDDEESAKGKRRR